MAGRALKILEDANIRGDHFVYVTGEHGADFLVARGDSAILDR